MSNLRGVARRDLVRALAFVQTDGWRATRSRSCVDVTAPDGTVYQLRRETAAPLGWWYAAVMERNDRVIDTRVPDGYRKRLSRLLREVREHHEKRSGEKPRKETTDG